MKQLNDSNFDAILKPKSIWLIPQNEMPITEAVEIFFGLKKDEIFTRTRKHRITIPRQVAMWLEYKKNIYEKKKPGYRQIKNKYPGEAEKTIKHATVYHAVKHINNLMDTEKAFRCKIFDLQIAIFNEIKYWNPKFKKNERR